MKVIKPGHLSVLTRCFEAQRRVHCGISVMAFVPLGDATTLLSEIALWSFVGRRLGRESVLDAAVPKTRAEFLVSGFAYTPGATPAVECPVRARVGSSEKILHVMGDRRWQGSKTTDPEPFTSMPIDWAHAYGGVRYPKNPLGKGHRPTHVDGVRIHQLPNVECPDRLIDARGQRVEPAGFLPIDISWPQRSKLAGTYDEHWRKNLFPGFAEDLDWEIFNVAPEDQRSDEQAWTAGERYEFQNLHPQRPFIEGALPKFTARVFVTLAATGPTALHEVPVALQTLWFFPDAERAVLVFTGSVRVREDDASDVLSLLAAAELVGEPRDQAHYAAVLAQRLDRDQAPMAVLRERDLLPPGWVGNAEDDFAVDRELTATAGLLEKNSYRRTVKEVMRSRAIIANYGLDPDEHGPPIPAPPPPPPSLEEMPEFIADMRADAERRRADAEARLETSRQRIDALIEGAGIEGFDRHTLAQERSRPPLGPPTFTAQGQRARLAALADESRRHGTVIDELEAMVADETMYARWLAAEGQLRDAYRRTAHMQEPAPTRPDTDREAVRDYVRRAVEQGETISALNLTGVDLSGMDLSGADLSGACLESARLHGTDLRGANLHHAILAHAQLSSTRLDDADLSGANLGRATLVDCSLRGANLTDSILEAATLTATDLSQARLHGASFGKATFERCCARAIEARGIVWIECDLRGLNLSGADLETSTWINVSLDGIDLSHSRLTSCTFVTCSAKGTNFASANLRGARFTNGCVLDDACLIDAEIVGTNLRETALARADLRRAWVDDTDFSRSTLVGATLYRAVARRVRFDRADLSDTDLSAANLMSASFRGARLVGANLNGANLHGSDMARVKTDGRIRMESALLTQVSIDPRDRENEHDHPGGTR